jgi:hypothetical protein
VVDDDSQDDAADEDVVAAWLGALGNAEDDDSDDDDSDDDDLDEEEGISMRAESDSNRDNDEPDEDTPETQDPNMQPLPEENEKKTGEREVLSQQVLCAEGQVSIGAFHGPWEHNKHQYGGGLRHFLS